MVFLKLWRVRGGLSQSRELDIDILIYLGFSTRGNVEGGWRGGAEMLAGGLCGWREGWRDVEGLSLGRLAGCWREM